LEKISGPAGQKVLTYENFGKKFRVLVSRYFECSYEIRKEYRENDTLTKFLLPLIEALGWNLCDFKEVKQEVSVPGLRGAADCILYLNDSPMVVWEFKPLKTTIEFHDFSTPKTVANSKLRGLEISKKLKAKYFVISSFRETVVWDGASEARIVGSILGANETDREQYQKMLWRLLSKSQVVLPIPKKV